MSNQKQRYARKIKQLYRLKHKQAERIAERKLSREEYDSILLCPTHIHELMDEARTRQTKTQNYINVIRYLRFSERHTSLKANLEYSGLL